MKQISIVKETIIGEDKNIDDLFIQYCDEYSIELKIQEKKEASEYPEVEFKSGPIALTNMLKERFGYTQQEIDEEFPQIKEALEEPTDQN